MIKPKNILLTGSTGCLGRHIKESGLFRNLLVPTKKTLDISRKNSIKRFFAAHSIHAVIHCAALARIGQCHGNPSLALNTNLIGTAHLIDAVLNQELRQKRSIRFIYISTDGVYASQSGNYSETSPTIPYSIYGWSKLGGECAVRVLRNFCIIRTRFYDPNNLRFQTAAVDSFSSSMSVQSLVEAIVFLLKSKFVGVVNVGTERHSDFECFKKVDPTIRPCRLKDIAAEVPFSIWKDASMDLRLWRKIKKDHALCKFSEDSELSGESSVLKQLPTMAGKTRTVILSRKLLAQENLHRA